MANQRRRRTKADSGQVTGPGPHPLRIEGKGRWEDASSLPTLYVDQMQVQNFEDVYLLIFGRTELPIDPGQETLDRIREKGVPITPIVRLAINPQKMARIRDILNGIVDPGGKVTDQ